MWIKKRHKIITNIVRPIMKLYLKIVYKIKLEKPIKIENGALIISNHTTSMDQFIVGLLFKENLYYMASHDIFQHKFLGKLIKFLVNPIPKEKGKSSDIQAIKSCLHVAKENGNICIFVEGNRTLSGKLGNVDYSIVKLVKALKKPLVICNIKGGFGTEPRWGLKPRKGKMEAGVKQIYDYSDIKDMSNDELYELIISNITVDDYNYYNNYKSNKKALYIERVLYICPVCGHMHTIYSKKNDFYCRNCNLKVTYNADLSLTSDNDSFKFKYLYELYDYQINFVKNKEYLENEIIYEDDILAFKPRMFNSKENLNGRKIKIYNDKLIIQLKDDDIILDFNCIDGITLLGKRKMNIYVGNTTYQVFNKKNTNLLKYMHLFYILKSRREGKECEFLGL